MSGWATRGQLAALAVELRRGAGLSSRAARLDWCEGQVGRRLDTSSELTRREARGLLRGLGRAHLPQRARPQSGA